jgi:hypothetical protein
MPYVGHASSQVIVSRGRRHGAGPDQQPTNRPGRASPGGSVWSLENVAGEALIPRSFHADFRAGSLRGRRRHTGPTSRAGGPFSPSRYRIRSGVCDVRRRSQADGEGEPSHISRRSALMHESVLARGSSVGLRGRREEPYCRPLRALASAGGGGHGCCIAGAREVACTEG